MHRHLLSLSAIAAFLLDGDLRLALTLFSIFLLISYLAYVATHPRAVYLIDHACYRPPDRLRAPASRYMNQARLFGGFDEASLEFQSKILERSGLGDETCGAEGLQLSPPVMTMQMARREAETVMFDALDCLFASTSTAPTDVGILVVNCSIFGPTPSMTSMIVNRYKMSEDLRSVNLAGMGCSAGIVAVDLACRLLQVHRDSLAVVISTENLTQSYYTGRCKSMLVTNCLFRLGASAVLLSNRPADRRRSKYRLVHTVRTHKGADGRAFGCVQQREDEKGKVGVALSRDVTVVAGGALKENMTTLGPLVLPMREQLLFLGALFASRLLGKERVKPYVPDFRTAFEHFCIHAGGKAVIDAIDRGVGLTPADVEATRMALHRFGNTSSSTVWYELAYSEAKGRVGKGDRVWQVAFGSGFKCNSAVWVALRKVKPTEGCNPWMDCIDRYPVEVADG